ncbi:MAG: murein L,D-transpeptidase catalytic domain family protein [Nevskia sp.]|nr:murein L,D-transpeptidase catalytic domain family protein [Nevskia sp.]
MLALLLPAAAVADGLSRALARAAPAANPDVIGLAVEAERCAVERGLPASERLAVIDYSRPSTEPRLWVFDLPRHKLLYQELVAHGRNSGDNLAHSFSNTDGSLESSLGLFRTLDTYTGHNGYSLRIDGLEPGINDHALQRDLVIHGAPYVSPVVARTQGRLGRSWGCPAVRAAVAPQLIDQLKGGQYLFAYYPDRRWLSSSPYLHCAPEEIAGAP